MVVRPRNALVAVAALAVCGLAAAAARAPTTPAASAPVHADELPARFLGLWRRAGEGSGACPAQPPGASNVSDDNLILVRATSIAFLESGCRVEGVSTATNRLHPERIEPTTVMLACEGEGLMDHHTEVWSVDHRDDGDVLTTLDIRQRVSTSYLPCGGGGMRDANARQQPGPAVTPPSPDARDVGAAARRGGDGQDASRAADARSAEPRAASGEIATCDAPWVLAYLKRTTLTPDVMFKLRLLGVPADRGTISGIVQLDYDRVGEHRLCRATLSLNVLTGPSSMSPISSGLRYRIDRRLDGDRGSWATCENCRW